MSLVCALQVWHYEYSYVSTYLRILSRDPHHPPTFSTSHPLKPHPQTITCITFGGCTPAPTFSPEDPPLSELERVTPGPLPLAQREKSRRDTTPLPPAAAIMPPSSTAAPARTSTSTTTSSSTASSSSSSSLSRISNIASHLAPASSTMASTTNFPADVVPQAPEDPLFGLMRAFRADESPDKMDLVGFYCAKLHRPSRRKFQADSLDP